MYRLKHNISSTLGLIILYIHITDTRSSVINDLALGFTRLPFNKSYYINHKPYNLPLEERYSFINGVHKLWVFSTDEPLSRCSPTLPRSELFINVSVGYIYFTGVWQFEAHVFVPNGTTGVSLMQVFGGYPHVTNTTLMVRVYDGNLYYYKYEVISSDMYDKWFRLNVIRDVEGDTVNVYINGVLKFEGQGRGGAMHYFKCGVYAQDQDSYYMESRWKHINIYKKSK
ncbi:putative concanavalin A-like lectin/glucanase domain superfamily, alginate lyase 2 [Helianthus annuus]|uniref:Concanavalin A-like lectin/glucanase domain superfamily, alginate lyase 2 n=1 Tax=Helianthus annuus TaxID=4232 RepID=A0A251U0F0_HELAN|nr:putative concanavalin A-like lectin/glucanase domain superfamily, alginate lyase 2 [Helianthus annuus]KAJ0490467.1 putative concanavalin A-like lectin/glucanase domain superfamily, alginate lyase 2 [Helianthus annuus]KAJ0494683.1 putative concanavalin A-like lectin/glucanase domain superfamily, alginate lyase 2 [Helianthus annuus]KAJ0506385.1 putative concanavalin A-like lectin/glucanase domain superfamily, alginate lyase 2 [Helianthus annuus]KAJ0676061.1 putative concanavalin A-like lectin/